MSDYVMRVEMKKHTSDRDEVTLWEYEYEIKDSDVDGIENWIKTLFGEWFWS